MIRKIVDTKNPVLRQKAKAADEKLLLQKSKKILSLIKDMKDTLLAQKNPEGIGLAAPQIGKSLRIFVVHYKKLERVIVNPTILEVGEEKKKPVVSAKKKGRGKEILEGCLSLPHYYGPIKRPSKIKISYLDENGKEQIEEFSGFEAQIIQHEIDHLNGILFIDKILEQNAPLYKFDGDDWEEVELI